MWNRVDVRMCGCADVWMCGCVDAWMRGCVDVDVTYVYGSADMWIYGCLGGDYHVNECGICVLPWVCNSLWFCAGRVWHRFAQAGLGLRRQGLRRQGLRNQGLLKQGLRRLGLHRDDA